MTRVVLDPGVRRIDDGRVLVGGSPMRLLRLTEAGARLVDRLAAGEPVPVGDRPRALVDRLLDAGMAHPRPDGVGFSAADVTVIVPVRDRAAGLAVTRAALGNVGAVVVVDDGSTTPVEDAAIRHPSPRGPAAARNSGWRAATTALVAFVDADVEPSEGWLSTVVAHFDDDRVGAVAPRITSVGGWLPEYEAVRSPLDLGPLPAAVHPRSRVPYVPTAALVVRRAALEDVGGFDESMHVGEDVDAVWRLHESGWRVRYEPTAVVRHPARSSLRGWLRQRVDYGSSAAPLTSRHPGDVAPVAVSPWSAIAWALAAAGRPVVGLGVGASTTALLTPRLRGVRHPWSEAARLAGLGHVAAGHRLADALVRAWWPAALVAGRRGRRTLLAAALATSAIDYLRMRPSLDPLRWTAAHIADDVAYGAGLWWGCVRERSIAALAPDLTTNARPGGTGAGGLAPPAA